jgi:hypothetical protein
MDSNIAKYEGAQNIGSDIIIAPTIRTKLLDDTITERFGNIKQQPRIVTHITVQPSKFWGKSVPSKSPS